MNLIQRRNDLWDPFDMLTDLQSEMNRVFNRSLTGRPSASVFHPEIDLREENDHYVLSADLPGLKREDFSLSVEGNHLTLKGERKREKEHKEKGYWYSERICGTFARTIEFPTELQAEKAKASFKDGVLEVILPKSENAKPKQISVEIK
ncbi:MAG: Hsp20/alpha crystallin family protein [Candidatus Omnitrophota bacterium]